MSGNRKSWIRPVMLAVVLTGAGGLGIAAAKSGDSGSGECAQRYGGHGHGGARFKQGRYLDGKLAFLKAELGITEQQDPAWREFAGVIRENQQARAEMKQSRREHRGEMRDEQQLALDERIDRRIEQMERRVAMIRQMADAAKTLYAQLTPEQRQVAEELFSHRRGRHFRF